jgi:hypothetical protein
VYSCTGVDSLADSAQNPPDRTRGIWGSYMLSWAPLSYPARPAIRQNIPSESKKQVLRELGVNSIYRCPVERPERRRQGRGRGGRGDIFP